jgi:predicted metalloprotease
MGVGDTVVMLSAVLTRIMNQAGQGGDFQVQANESEEINFEQVYKTEKVEPQQFEIFLKQQRFEVQENETWLQVLERLAAMYQMPKWSIFKIVPVDGEITPILSSSDEEDPYTFDWKPAK